MESTPCVERLRLYRLENDLTFDQLADRMRASGYPVHTRNLHRILVNDLENGPRDGTMFKVERFVALLGGNTTDATSSASTEGGTPMNPHDTDTDDQRVDVFDQLPDDLQDAFLRAIAEVLVKAALAELDDHGTVVITTERKAG